MRRLLAVLNSHQRLHQSEKFCTSLEQWTPALNFSRLEEETLSEGLYRLQLLLAFPLLL